MSAYPHYPRRDSRKLDGVWEFAWLGEELPQLEEIDASRIVYNELMAVPGCFDAAPKYAGKRGVGAYRLRLEAPAYRQMRLRIGGLGLRGRLLWDSRELMIDEMPYSPLECEFHSGPGRSHELVILVDNRFDAEATPLMHPFYDFYGYGGVYRSLELETLPDGVRFDRVRVSTIDVKHARVKLEGSFRSRSNFTPEISFGFDGAPLKTLSVRVTEGKFTIDCIVPGGKAWTPAAPHLHTVTLRCADDEIVERFGIRTVRCSKGEILLNGKPVRLKGYNRHDTHPQFGPAMTPALWLEDLQILRDLNCNFIRGCHYPQNQEFLDLCDQLGFLVWEESLGWGDRVEVQENPKFRELQKRQTVNMVRTSINHPSVIIWGFMNEGGDDKEVGASLMRELAGLIRQEDPTRPITMASMHVRTSLCLDAYDIISFNLYPGWYGPGDPDPRPLHLIAETFDDVLNKLKRPELIDKPMILSEIGAGAIYGWRDRVRTMWSEEYQADYLDEVCRCFEARPRLNGLAIWHFADSRTYAGSAALSRPRAFNNKGTLDEYRRPKGVYDVVKRHFAKIK